MAVPLAAAMFLTTASPGNRIKQKGQRGQRERERERETNTLIFLNVTQSQRRIYKSCKKIQNHTHTVESLQVQLPCGYKLLQAADRRAELDRSPSPLLLGACENPPLARHASKRSRDSPAPLSIALY